MVVLSSEMEHLFRYLLTIWKILCVCSCVHVFWLLQGGNEDKNSLIIR